MRNYRKTFTRLLPNLLVAIALSTSLVFILGGMSKADVSPLDHTSTRQEFIHQMASSVKSANQAIVLDRTRLQKDYKDWQAGKVISKSELAWLTDLAVKYKISDINLSEKADWDKLLPRVDIIPGSIVVAQAINESAWGKSRFAVQGNNLFGRWCFKPGCGIIPKGRKSGDHHELKKFSSKQASIVDYLHNINTNEAYTSLRKMRQTQHKNAGKLNAKKLTSGLLQYSSRGQAYINDIVKIMKKYHLDSV